MIPDVDAVRRFRVQRITDTVEDALVLLELQLPAIYAKHELAVAAVVVRSASDKARSEVYSDPTVAMWSLLDLSPLLETTNAPAAIELAEGLATQIRYVAVAISFLDGRSYRTRVRALTHLPGLGVATGRKPEETWMIDIEVRPSARLLVNGKPVSRSLPYVFSDFVIPQGDSLLAPPVLEGYEPEALDEAAIARWSELLGKVRPLVERSDEAASLVETFGRRLFPLRASLNGNHLSVSFKHRPGIIYLSWSSDYLEVAEAIVHEADHQCLYEVINEDPLFADEPINFQPVFRSPWRSDPRPLSGLFFGFSAFVTVGVFWQLIANRDSGPLAISAGGRAMLALDQALDAMALTQQHASLTEKGNRLLETNQSRAREAMRKLERLQDYPSWAARSRDRRTADAQVWREAHRGEDVVGK